MATSITIGLTAIGLLGYSNSIARDRDKAVFQRLRVAPVPSWSIMASRLLVQVIMIMILITVVLILGNNFDKITLTPKSYVLIYITGFAGAAVYLSLGQVVVGLIKNPETVNSTSRLIYLVFIMVGMFATLNKMGKEVGDIVKWSPYGTVKYILYASMEQVGQKPGIIPGMQPFGWDNNATIALMVTFGYAIVFAFLGIKWFKWSSAK